MRVFGVVIPFTRATSPRGPPRHDYQESRLSSDRLLNEIHIFEGNEISCSKNLSQKIIRSFSPRRTNRSCESLDDDTNTKSGNDDIMGSDHEPNMLKARKNTPRCPSGGQKNSRCKTNRSDDQKLENTTTSANIRKGAKSKSGNANDMQSKEHLMPSSMKTKDIKQNQMKLSKGHIKLYKAIGPVERKKCPSVSSTSSQIPILRKEKCPKVEKSNAKRVERKIDEKYQQRPRSTSTTDIPGSKLPLILSQKSKSTSSCSARTTSKENIRNNKLKNSFDDPNSTDIIERINRELAIMGVEESQNKNAPDSGIWSLSSTNSDTENSKGNLIMCSVKKGDNARKVEMKSAKITKNLKLCSRKCSSSVESNIYQIRSGTRNPLITIENELHFSSREDSETQSEAFHSFSTTNESVDNTQNSSFAASNVPATSFKKFILQSPRNQLFQTAASVDEVRKMNATRDENGRTTTERPPSSRCSSNSSKEHAEKLSQRNTIGIPISTQSLINVYQTVPTLINSSKEISDINNHIYKTIVSNKPLSTSSPLLMSLVAADDVISTIVKPNVSKHVGEYSSPSSIPVSSPLRQFDASKKVSRKNPYTLCYKMSTSFLTNKVSEKNCSSGLYAKMTPVMNTDEKESIYSGSSTLIQPPQIKENTSSKLVEICNEVHNYPESTEACGAYPASLFFPPRNGLIPKTSSQTQRTPQQSSNADFVIGGEISSSTICPKFENLNKVRLQTTGPHSLDSIFLQQSNERENSGYSNNTPENYETTSQLCSENPYSCEATEAAQLEQRLRSLGCELVTLRSKLPPSIHHAAPTPMSPTHNSTNCGSNHSTPNTIISNGFPILASNQISEGSKKNPDGDTDQSDPSDARQQNHQDPIHNSNVGLNIKQKGSTDGINGRGGMALRAQEVEDLIHLAGPLTEDAVLKTLQARFMTQQNYTNVGPILLSINPYNDVGNALTLTSTRAAPQSPHLLRVVHEAVRQQSETGYPQAIILSGSSGSGKTYLSMLLLRQLFDVAGGGLETDAFKHLAAAFTVLRSLGSAKTTSNSESSRIGHFIEVQVTDGALYRTKIHCYFLDQTRVVRPLPDEKNYHIFYQMLAGLTQEERAKLHLQGHSVRTLSYLSEGDIRQDEANDARRFEAWKACLGVLGIQVLDVVRVLAAILLLGNVTFIEGQGLEVDIQGGSHELKSVAALLGVSSAALYSGLTTRTHNVRGQLVKSMLDANMSNMTRDALSKALYCRTVATIVRRANSLKRLGSTSGTLSSDSNESVHHQVEVASRHASTVGTAGSKASKSMSVLNSAVKHATDGFIGILDMFGFEEPKPAHLEHLCINLCAETMQHFYNTHIFKSSIESCREEGIACEVEVDYLDNVPCIDLISSLRTGLLSILDLECSVRSTPENYIQKVKVQHKGNIRLFEPKTNIVRTFGIHHFASRVVYDASNFLDTNKDILSDDMVSVFQKPNCNFGFATHLFGSELKALYSQEPVPRGMSFRISPTSHTDLQNGYEPISTLTQDFHTRLDNLLRTLVHAKPHFIRCIRANATEKPSFFDRATVIKQIRALQVLETVNLMAGGFPHRMRFKTFSLRYRLLAPFKRLRRTEDKTVEDCKLILECVMKQLDDICKNSTVLIQWALGKRHIFLSEGARQQLEILRIETRHRAATLIQAIWRGWHLRRKWPNLRRNLELRARTRPIRPRPQPIAGTPPPEVLDRCSQKAIQQTCSRIGLDLERPPPVPPSRPYTITGNHKLGYPQTRVMNMGFPEDGSGDIVLRKGQTVLVIGASHQRGNLLVEYQGHSVHVPYQFMELSAQPGVSI